MVERRLLGAFQVARDPALLAQGGWNWLYAVIAVRIGLMATSPGHPVESRSRVW